MKLDLLKSESNHTTTGRLTLGWKSSKRRCLKNKKNSKFEVLFYNSSNFDPSRFLQIFFVETNALDLTLEAIFLSLGEGLCSSTFYSRNFQFKKSIMK